MDDYAGLLEFLYLAPVGLARTDALGRVIQMNPAMTSILMSCDPGFPASPGLSLPDVLDRHMPGFGSLLRGKLGAGPGRLVENLRISVERPTRIDLRVACSKLPGGEVAYVIEDITASEAVEATRRQLAAELDGQKERLAQIGQAVRTVVHDLRSPMSVLAGISELADELSAEKFRQLFVEAGRPTLLELRALMEDLLDHSRVDQPPRMTAIQARELTSRIEFKLAALSRSSGVPIVLRCDSDSVIVCNPEKLIRIFDNVIGNAVKALSRDKPPKPLITATLADEGDHLAITIADNGKGIPSALLDKLFDPFAVRSEYVGNGLGLSIVKQIVDLHRGTIAVQSSPSGTIFTIRLPLQPDATGVNTLSTG
jgi:signal transduction histidine kinase